MLSLISRHLPPLITHSFSLAGKPRIDRTNVKDVVIKVGQQHLYDIDIIGEPKPTNEWTVEGKVSGEDSMRDRVKEGWSF